MKPIDVVLDRLKREGFDPRKNGTGWKVCCPAHDDQNPSLKVSEADDGKVLLHCYAGCSFDAIIGALKIDQTELFPADRNGASNGRKELPKGIFATFPEARDWFGKKEGITAKTCWTYHNAAGLVVFYVQRYDKPDGDKKFVPIRREPNGWRIKGVDGKLPLYHLSELAVAQTVWVLEGEKCADLARGLALVATTSAHGSSGAMKSDWSPLAGKTVYLIPDNDKAGDGYALTVAGILAGLDPKPAIKVVKLPLAKQGDDIEQWLGAGGTIEQLNEIVHAAPEWAPISNSRPDIEVTTSRYNVAQEAIKALAADDSIYVRGGDLGIVVEEEEATVKLAGGVELANARGSARFLPLSRSRLGCHLTQCAMFYEMGVDRKGNPISREIHPPGWLVEAVETWGEWPGFRSLLTITQCPYIRADGSIPAPGYDPSIRALYRPSGRIGEFPAKPGKPEAVQAKDRLNHLVWQFPFKDGFDFSVWLAALLTAIQRPVIGGPVPGFAFVGNKAGTGKGLLIDAAGLIAWGNGIPTRSYPVDQTEAAKVKLSLALAGVSAVHLDNLPEGGFYGSTELDSAVTSATVSGRILGQSKESGSVPLRPVWFLSGNNISPLKDAYRRWLPCRLDTTLESPYERDDLEVSGLRDYLAEHRPELLAAALTILRGHALAERPVGWKAPLGSFEEWDKIIRGAVWWVTGNDCLTTQRLATNESPERSEKKALLNAWAALPDGRAGLTVSQAIDLVRVENNLPSRFPDVLAAFKAISKDGRLSANAIGYKIRGMQTQNIDGMRFERIGNHRVLGVLWRVVEV